MKIQKFTCVPAWDASEDWRRQNPTYLKRIQKCINYFKCSTRCNHPFLLSKYKSVYMLRSALPCSRIMRFISFWHNVAIPHGLHTHRRCRWALLSHSAAWTEYLCQPTRKFIGWSFLEHSLRAENSPWWMCSLFWNVWNSLCAKLQPIHTIWGKSIFLLLNNVIIILFGCWYLIPHSFNANITFYFLAKAICICMLNFIVLHWHLKTIEYKNRKSRLNRNFIWFFRLIFVHLHEMEANT